MMNTSGPSGSPNQKRPDLCGYQVLDLGKGRGQLIIPHILYELKTDSGDICHQDDGAQHKNHQGLEKPGDAARSNRGQIFSYAAHMMSAYPRLFLFVVFVFGERARLIRLDRSGGIITRSFLYKKTNYLSQFLFRYSKLDDHRRGMDPTASLATPAEAELLSTSLAAYKARLAPRNTDYLDPTLNSAVPAYKIHVKSKTPTDEDTEFDLIVQYPFADCQSLIGRCTRGYAAYHVQEERLVFLKDCWRVDDDTIKSEVDIYKRLFAEDSNVTGLPDVIALDDVIHDGQLQATFTQELANADDPEPWFLGCRTLDKLVHVRIVQELAIPLDSALNSREVIVTIYDVVVCK